MLLRHFSWCIRVEEAEPFVHGECLFLYRFTNENVVVTAPSKVKAGSDLQLPSMAALVSKTSSQAFFLRILKVIVQIREAVRLANAKKAGNLSYMPYDFTHCKKFRRLNLQYEILFKVNQTSETAMDTGTTSNASETGTFIFLLVVLFFFFAILNRIEIYTER